MAASLCVASILRDAASRLLRTRGQASCDAVRLIHPTSFAGHTDWRNTLRYSALRALLGPSLRTNSGQYCSPLQ
jgi:hypothetical protein